MKLADRSGVFHERILKRMISSEINEATESCRKLDDPQL
jgi:hypothetical protein